MPDPDDATEIGRLPLLTEVARLHLRRRVTARVRVAVTTTAEDRQVEALRRVRQAEIHRVPMRREVEAPPPVRQEGDVVIIPVVEEEVVLVRRLVVTEEIHLRLRVEEVPVTLATQLARQVVTVTRLPPSHCSPTSPFQEIATR